MFTGFSKEDSEALYDTKESAIERAKMMKTWQNDPDAKILIHRERVPLWFAHLVSETPLWWLGYTELVEN